MKFVHSIILVLICVFSLGSVCYAAGEPVGFSYNEQSYVAVTGNAGEINADKNAVLMLVKNDADLDSIQKSDIGYIAQEVIAEDGTYSFEFEFSGFTYDSDKNVNNYQVILNVNGVKMTPTITKATAISDMFISFELDFSNFGRAFAEITNEYNLKDVKYTALIAFYDKDGRLLDVKNYSRYTGDDSVVTYGYNDVPENTEKAKAFLWESKETLIPLAEAKEMDIFAHTSERSVMTMSISPGIDETQRNFAWYDIPGIENAKIQIAEKVNGDVTDFDDNAVTFEATCGEVTAAQYNGTPLNANNPDTLFEYTGEYSWAKATVTGLENGKEYVYRVGDKFGWCKDIYDFSTAEAPDDGIEFLIFADEHFRPNNLAVDNAVVNATGKAFDIMPEPDMVMALGDNVDLPWYEDAYVRYFSRDYTNEIPLATVPGPTHDMLMEPKSASLFGYHFNMPNQSSTPESMKDVCGNYWFRQGDVLFIALAHNWDSHANHEAFIKSAVEANTDAKWKILYSHLPFVPEGSEDAPESYFKNDDSDFIYENGIDVALFAHTHVSFRTFPMIKGVAQTTDESVVAEMTDPNGVVYMTVNPTSARNNDIVKRDYMAFADTDALHGVSLNNYLTKEYHTSFATAKVITTDTECSLEIETYRNTHNPGIACEIKDTQKIDTFKIIKTK